VRSPPKSGFRKPIKKQFARPTSPLGLVLAGNRGQGSHATVSKAEIEAVCMAYVAAHACFDGVLRTAARGRLVLAAQPTSPLGLVLVVLAQEGHGLG
jgi:hypothetical protein